MQTSPWIRRVAAGAACIVAAVLSDDVSARDRGDCERDFKPQVGQSGKDVVWVPTPDDQVQRMLHMAEVTPQDVVYDLGAGDGKIAIAAGKLGATAIGIEFDPDMARFASCLVAAEGVGTRARIVQGDIFKEDFSRATVITMYLLPELNLCVRHRLLAMQPGTRVASHQFTMGDWAPDATSELGYGRAYLWIVPARVGGSWVLRLRNGPAITINLAQEFQKVSGDVVSGAPGQALAGASLRGNELRFAFSDDKGIRQNFSGTVRGGELVGTLQDGNAETAVTGAPRGSLHPAAWAGMLPQCGSYYRPDTDATLQTRAR
jgi:SAM-dependent methyltransferase